MGLFFRKSLKLGPIRLTASKSGVSTSIGLRGARVTVGPRGTYVSISGGGVTYRRKIDDRPVAPRSPPPPRAPSVPQPDAGYIATASIDTLAETSPDASLNEIAEQVALFNWFNFYMWAGGIIAVLGGCVLTAVHPVLLVLPLMPFAACAVPVYLWDRERRTARLIYDVDDDELITRLSLCNIAGDALARGARIWHVYSQVQTSDRKRNAGATSLIRRTAVRCVPASLPRIECNVEPYSIPVGPQRLLFLPDRMLVQEGNRFAAVPYEQLTVDAAAIEFIEDQGVPPDARQIGTTWRYVNKSGGPDRRFSNNPMLPILEYGRLTLRSPTGATIVVDTSALWSAQRAAEALRELSSRAAGAHKQAVARASAPAAAPPLPSPRLSEGASPGPARPAFDAVVRAVAVLLRYVAAADRKITAEEIAYIETAIAEAAHGDESVRVQLVAELPGLRSSAEAVQDAVDLLKAASPQARLRLLELAQGLAGADGKVTPKERERLKELRGHLGG